MSGLSSPLPAPVQSRSLFIRQLIGPATLPGRFALSDGMNILRLCAGLFYAPHVLQKLLGLQASMAFFAKAGLTPPAFFLGLSLVFESLSFVCLTFGFFTRWVALVSAGCMVVAAYAIIQVRGLGWYWAQGGIEYLVFWSLASIAIAVDAWRKEQALPR